MRQMVSPEEIRLYTKAPFRKKAQERKKGKSRILTDTPEIDEI